MSDDTRVLATPTMNEEINAAVRAALDPADVRAAILAEAEKQGRASDDAVAAQAAADQAVADKDAADAAHAAAPKAFTRTETIAGTSFNFEAATEIELERMVNNAYRVAYAVQKTEATATVVDPATTAAAAKKEAEAATARKAELELNFRSGNITAAEYIEQSGAMSEYLASQGVPLDQLKQVVEQTQMNSEAQSWADAVEDFKNSPAGNDWPGGDGNLVTLNDKLLSLGLEDSTDRVGALTRAYAAMRKAGQVIPYTPPAEEPTNTAEEVADGASRRALADKLANDAAAAAAALKAKPLAARTSSSLFGASSGVSDIPTTTTTKAGATIEIPREVSPAEIIDAWKKAVVAQGGSPNDEFKSAFAGKAR